MVTFLHHACFVQLQNQIYIKETQERADVLFFYRLLAIFP